MISSLNIGLGVLGFTLMAVSWILTILKKDESYPLFAWASFILLAVSALANVTQDFPYCQYVVTNSTTAEGVWKCTTYSVESWQLTAFYGAFAILQLMFAIIITFWKTYEKIV